MKRCRCCNEVKPDSEFCRASINRDGLHSYCKPCHKEKRKKWAISNITIEEACERVLSRCVQMGDCLIYRGGDYAASYVVAAAPTEVSQSGREYAHRLIYIHAYGAIPNDKLVHHTCEHKLCCNAAHLELRGEVEHSSYHNIGVAKEHPCQGERHGRAKLHDSDIPKILSIGGHKSQREIASEFGVSRSIISGIIRGVSWKHIPREGWDYR